MNIDENTTPDRFEALPGLLDHLNDEFFVNINNSKIDLNQYVPLRKIWRICLEGSRPLKTLIWPSFYPFPFLLISLFSLFLLF